MYWHRLHSDFVPSGKSFAVYGGVFIIIALAIGSGLLNTSPETYLGAAVYCAAAFYFFTSAVFFIGDAATILWRKQQRSFHW